VKILLKENERLRRENHIKIIIFFYSYLIHLYKLEFKHLYALWERKKETFYLLFIFIIYIKDRALIVRVNFEHYWNQPF
jgi:hypothetical protein